MKVCLDTNAYSRLAQGDDEVCRILERADSITVPAVVIGELTYGFLNGSRRAENEAALERFLEEDDVSCQPVTRSIAERYGYVKAALKKKGTPIPENDIWIAATALETGCWLVTYDAHFNQVSGLVLAPRD